MSLQDILLVDNNLYCYALNLENGVPVQHYMGDKNDRCLLQIMNYLEYIKDFDNLAAQNEKIYEFKKIFDSDINQFIKFYDMQSSINSSIHDLVMAAEEESQSPSHSESLSRRSRSIAKQNSPALSFYMSEIQSASRRDINN